MPYSPRNIKIACNHRGLTHFGGVHLFHEFLRVLHFRDFLAQQIRYPRRNRDYSLSQMLLALIYPIVLGLDRIETASLLRSNGTFQYPIHRPYGDSCCTLLFISESSYTAPMIACSKDSFTCPITDRA